jgi:hypothetical protein
MRMHRYDNKDLLFVVYLFLEHFMYNKIAFLVVLHINWKKQEQHEKKKQMAVLLDRIEEVKNEWQFG